MGNGIDKEINLLRETSENLAEGLSAKAGCLRQVVCYYCDCLLRELLAWDIASQMMFWRP